MRLKSLFMLLALLAGAHTAWAQSPPPEGARVFFRNLADGDVVNNPFLVQFGAERVKVTRAGISLPGTGHHHLLINAELTDADRGFAIPDDARHRHFTSGQTEVELTLEPGTYTLMLVFGDGDHVPHDPMLTSEKVTITVE